MTHDPTTGASPSFAGHPVRRARGALRLSAAERMVEAGGRSGRVAAKEFIDAARRYGISLDNMWCSVETSAQQGGGSVARTACLAVPGAGRTLMFFTSAVREELVDELARVIERACDASPNGTLAQALLEPGEGLAQRSFEKAGFGPVGTLDYLSRDRPKRAEIEGWFIENGDLGDGVRMVNAPARDDSALVKALDATYEGTLDCPELCGLRSTRDVIESHRATGVFDPALWWIIEREVEPLGAVLFNPNPPLSSVELVYMGLSPALRGTGIATRALRHAIASCATRAEKTITCAVDRRNAPARALYERHGFEPVQTRIALVKQVLARSVP